MIDSPNAATASASAAHLQPLGDRIILRRLRDDMTKGGIFIPKTAENASSYATVVAVGPGRLLESGERAPTGLKAGDTVVMPQFYGQEIKLDGEMLRAAFASDVLAVVDSE